MLMRTDSFRDLDRLTERNVLSVQAERTAPASDSAERVVDERSYGVFSRQTFLGDTPEADRLTANYDAEAATITIPIADKAKPRRVETTGGGEPKEVNS